MFNDQRDDARSDVPENFDLAHLIAFAIDRLQAFLCSFKFFRELTLDCAKKDHLVFPIEPELKKPRSRPSVSADPPL
jgi:hypothetical protein